MAQQYPNWWDELEPTLVHLSGMFPPNDIPLALKALRDGTCMVFGRFVGKVKEGGEDFQSLLKTAKIIPYSKYNSTTRYAANGVVLCWSVSGDVHTVEWTASFEELGAGIRTMVEACLAPVVEVKKVPPVYGFSYEHGQYQVREIGRLTDTFVSDNYDPEVVVKYSRIVSELKKPDPAGRLVLVEGAPGTGKTRMVRALIGSLMETSKCIVVPPSLMDRLSGPEFTMCLIYQRMENRSLTLILEDADDCLIAREKNSAAKASLTALLNLSDGVMGATLDIRVIATTNQELGSIDRAILRPGRLLDRVHVGPLSARRAEEVFTRLTKGGVIEYHGPTTLAQVYEDARVFDSRQA